MHPAEHRNRGAKRAREAREALGLDALAPISCLLDVVEQAAGWPVVVWAMGDLVAGACWRRGDRVLLHVNGEQAWVRQRFTLAHEVGHAWCRHGEGRTVDTQDTMSGAGSGAPFEIEANAFAAELLLPKAAMAGLEPDEPTLEDLVRIASAFGVSAEVVLIRCRQAKCVGERRAARLKGGIDEGLHLPLYGTLGLEGVAERLRELARLPYWSPALAGSQLAAARG